MKRVTLAAVALFIACWNDAGLAMTFRTQWNPQDKINSIVGEGPIEDGDAQRLETIIPKADRDQYGNNFLGAYRSG